MLPAWLLIIIAVAYVAVLFAVAYYGDRRPEREGSARMRATIYSLSLAVYCTSWTFYGAVGSAATTGWGFIPIYLGPVLMMMLGWDFMLRLVTISRQRNITSIADFIASRYGRARALAVLVTLIAIAGAVPYIALQLKGVSTAIEVVTDLDADSTYSIAAYVALFLAVFSILFGTRKLDATEHHRGMMWALALESVVKLLAFVAVGLFAVGLVGGFGEVTTAISQGGRHHGLFAVPPLPSGFVTMTLLSAMAIFCLPRQFHVTIVEYSGREDIRMARWMFPIYLAIFSLFVVPIAVAGLDALPPGTDGDAFVLLLPAQAQTNWLSLLSFIGGFSAATGMVIVASVALATMVSNDIVLPLILRWRKAETGGDSEDLSTLLLNARRLAIVAITVVAYGYFLVIDSGIALASIGLLSFSAAAQFAPAMVVGVYWPRASAVGALSGLLAGFGVWLYALFIPGLLGHGWAAGSWLDPQALFGSQFDDPLTHGVVWSLSINLLVLIGVSLWRGQTLSERFEVQAFAGSGGSTPIGDNLPTTDATVSDLMALASRFVGLRNAELAYARYHEGQPAPRSGPADAPLLRFTENLLSGSIGTASARSVMSRALTDRGVSASDVTAILADASQAVQFNRRLLRSTLDNLPQGVSVIDEDLHVVGWNRAYVELFDYPDGTVYIGCPVQDLLRFNAERGYWTDGDIESEMEKRLNRLILGTPYRAERIWPDGRVIEVQGAGMPNGGYITTYTDITERKRIEQALRDSEASVRLFTDNAPAMLAYIDRELFFQFANRAYLDFIGVERDMVIGRRIDNVLSRTDLMKRSPYIEAALKGEKQQFELDFEAASGETIYALGTYIPDRDPAGYVNGLFAIFQDITTRRNAELALQEVNETLEQRVAQRTHELTDAVAALREAKADAETANQAKTRFLAAASHDLLQPLNAARLFTSVLVQHVDAMAPEQANLTQRIDASLTAAEGLLSALLDVSRLERGALTPEPVAMPLQSLFDQLEEQFQALSAQHGLRLRVRPTPLWVESDPQMLQRIVQNFVSNALRYTQTGGVLVAARRRGEQAEIGVWDTGPGIPDAEREQIFEEFKRLDRPSNEQQGLGLGLSISERMAGMLGHALGLKTRVGSGSCFSVRLPITSAVASTSPAREEAPTGPALAGIRTLCIDNDPTILDGMQALLQRWSCEVRLAGTGDEAWSQLEGYAAQVVLADYHLDHGENGLDVLERLRPRLDPRAVIVIVSADHGKDLEERVEQSGYRMIRKPVKPARLRAIIEGALQS
ncbi:MAG: PAS-domain containing protein [Xanthomonadales bacterium]|nr:PAS-domain containing protein [Xanthomonadales bacterium]